MSAIIIKSKKELKYILPELDLNSLDREVLTNSKIDKITLIDYDQKLNINLKLSDRISDDAEKSIIDYFKKNIPYIKDIRVTQNIELKAEPLLQMLNRFWNESILSVCAKKPIIKNLMNCIETSLVENEFRIGIPDKSIEREIHKCGLFEILNSHIKKDIDKDIKIKIETNNELMKKICKEAQIINKTIKTKKEVQKNKSQKKEEDVIYGKNSFEEPADLKDISSGKRDVTVKGKIIGDVKFTDVKTGKRIYSFLIYDQTSSAIVKLFVEKNKILSGLNKNETYIFRGSFRQDKFLNNEIVLFPKNIRKITSQLKTKKSQPRSEFHLHSKLSMLDSVVDLEDLALAAESKNVKSIAITDHGVVHSFPVFYRIMKKKNIKPVFGLEGYLVDDEKKIFNGKDGGEYIRKSEMVIFDLETTSLSAISGEVIEIGAVKVKNGKMVDEFSVLIKQETEINQKTTDITGITNQMLKDNGIEESEAIKRFKDFIGDSILIAHNAEFDIGFLRKLFGTNIKNSYIDTLLFFRGALNTLKNYTLKNITKHLNIQYNIKHRAISDSRVLARAFLRVIQDTEIKKFDELNNIIKDIDHKKQPPSHVTMVAKNRKGLYNLYKIVSESHIKYFYRNPKILKSLLKDNRDGLLIGSACSAGELFRAIIANKPEKELNKIISFYDYVEVQPPDILKYMIKNNILKSEKHIESIIDRIIKLAEKNSKPVIVTCDAHCIEKSDFEGRSVLLAGQDYSDFDTDIDLSLKSGLELEREFRFLNKDTVKKIIYKNPDLLTEQIEDFPPIPDGFYPPHLDNAEGELYPIIQENLKKYYGDNPDKKITDRLDMEWERITKNRFSVLYLAAMKLVKKSLDAGYPVGSRGSVGSSFLAFLAGISEINPLAAHLRCPECKNVIWDEGFCGADVKIQKCETCGSRMVQDGFNIPFEAFTGFDGTKVPDIDLNFSSIYQGEIFKTVQKMFGEKRVFRAGTIIGLKEKNALAFVRAYEEKKETLLKESEKQRLAYICNGVKRTTGQHPGGMIVLPPDYDIYNFTPIQLPPGKKSAEQTTPTTHFDYHEMESQLVKLDILGHDTPTILRLLKEYTGVDPFTVPLNDKETLNLFHSIKELNISDQRYRDKVGTIAVPEFGTSFVRKMLVDIKPKTFSDLVRISGLSHGENVWLNNAQDLITKGLAKFDSVICVREDIMNQLIKWGLDPLFAFQIMESVRKGKGLKEEWIEKMKQQKIKKWYIDSCNKIKYLFPKAHAVAYTLVSFRIAYYKVHYPAEFYAVYFSTQTDNFSIEIARKGINYVYKTMKDIEERRNTATDKEKKLYNNLEVLFEMYARGIKLSDINLQKSDIQFFKVEKGKVIPSLMTVDGLGYRVAKSISDERDREEFSSIEDFKKRTLINKTLLEKFRNAGVLKDIPESNQTSLF